MEWLIQNEPLIRMTCFLGILCLMLIWEQISPKRAYDALTRRRICNILLSLINTVALRLLPAISAVAASHLATTQHSGLFNAISIPFGLSLVLSILILDMAIYFQHRVFHAVPWLWRLHRVHHSDEHIDTTTAIRFHPIEIILSMLIKFALVYLLGAPVEAVILFEIILNGGALFNHGNVHIPKRLDALLRLVIITPDVHRVHHSTKYHEMNSNFGFSFSMWDRIFGSYQEQPEKGHTGMNIGIHTIRGPQTSQLSALLLQPKQK